jgi:hypothetical protein
MSSLKKFNPSATRSARAVQAWLILVGAAMNRQSITYKQLGQKMYGRPAAGVLAQILDHVAWRCKAGRLPPLTAIVVGMRRGRPGSGIPIDMQKLDRLREKVYAYDWYNVVPPTEDDFNT